ncbi:hypothetical protein ACFQZI_19795 [Mucilaginibacter lutimaris]|uniref:Outer membrane protein beta-barrel domain-containing protein n=1 Tax=Mucilaginibacter lutimaris TaxID=931629 RepID=A0ABW2ZLM8_9SPHI
MIKTLQLSLAACALVFACSLTASAQNQYLAKQDSLNKVYANKQGKTVFFELLGPGAVYSVNYDTRFAKRPDGWGGRIGLSYYSESGEHLFTAPLVVNYLAGKHGKYFEVGAGITYYNVNTNDVFFDNRYYEVIDPNGGYYVKEKNHNGVLGTLNFGYRYQPLDGGFAFRTGVSPVFTQDRFLPWWPYVSFGYSF